MADGKNLNGLSLEEFYKEASFQLGRAIARIKFANSVKDPYLKNCLLESLPDQFKHLVDCFLEVSQFQNSNNQ